MQQLLCFLALRLKVSKPLSSVFWYSKTSRSPWCIIVKYVGSPRVLVYWMTALRVNLWTLTDIWYNLPWQRVISEMKKNVMQKVVQSSSPALPFIWTSLAPYWIWWFLFIRDVYQYQIWYMWGRFFKYWIPIWQNTPVTLATGNIS